MAASVSPNDIFLSAVASFEAGLSERQRCDFRGCSLQQVEDTIRSIESDLALQRKQRNMHRIAKFLEGMNQLGRVIEVFVNSESTVAFIWGPIKFALLAAGTWVETLDCLLDTYAEIGDVLPGLSQYGDLLKRHPYIGVHLHSYYCDVLEFHRKALSVFSRPRWKTAFHSAWRTFKTQFGPILAKLRRHRDLLSDEKITAAIREVRDSRQSMEERLDKLSSQLQQLHLDKADADAQQHHETLLRKRQLVFSMLDPPDYLHDMERALEERGNSASGDWLLTNAVYQQWADTSSTGSQNLYLTGIPGTGKTVLTSRVVQYLQQLRDSRSETDRGFLVLYFFFKHSQPDKRTFTGMLLSLISQAVSQDAVLLDLVYQRCIRSGQQKVRSLSLLRELAELALTVHNAHFIILDGLDECMGRPGEDTEKAQREVIDWLASVSSGSTVRQEHGASAESNEACVRLLISGQMNGLLDDRLSAWPTIRLDSTDSHLGDLKAYVESESMQIQCTFGIEDDTRLDLITRVLSTAKGMFLYAKVVLGNLINQETKADLRRELLAENFPTGMHQAYERVVVHVLDTPGKERTLRARSILGFIICAERPLTWKEIQSRLCIRVDAQTADPDLRLLRPCKKYCGSLVEVQQNTGRSSLVSASGGVIELVHETARSYLLRSGRFHLTNLHADMALFCAQYLSSSPFSLERSESERKEHCLTGYYGFVDYAAANWWRHARQVDSSRDLPALKAVAGLAHLLSPHHEDQDAITGGGMPDIWARMHHLSDDGRDWEDTFPTEARIQPIRSYLEAFFNDQESLNSLNVGGLGDLYGQPTYKCTKPWCHSFHSGFESSTARDKHVKQHERPFRCNTDGCPGSQIGFSKESDLVRHNNRLHSEISPVEFPSDTNDIFTAAENGDLQHLQELVADGFNVNSKNKKGATPLFLAAQAGNYQGCRWLLEHGAKVNTRCIHGRTALYAAVANDDLDIARLLLEHHADIFACSQKDGTLLHLMKRKGCSRVSEAFPQTFWRHHLCDGKSCRVRKVTISPITKLLERHIDILRADFTGIDSSCLDINVLMWRNKTLREFWRWGCYRAYNTERLTQFMEILLEGGRIDVDMPNSEGNLHLHYACMELLSPLVSRLFPLSTFPNTRNGHGYTPFNYLLESPNESIPRDFDIRAQLISEILKTGMVDVNEAADQERIPLQRALIKYPSLHTVLQYGAYHLNAHLIRDVLSSNPAVLHRSLWVPSEREELALAFREPIQMDYKPLSTPLFISMNAAFHKHSTKGTDIADFKDVFDALLLDPSLDLHDDKAAIVGDADFQGIKLCLINECCDSRMVCRMVDAGLSIPWQRIRWDGDEAVFSGFQDPDGDDPVFQDPAHRLKDVGILLAAVRNRKDMFLDLFRQNLAFAEGLLDSRLIDAEGLGFDVYGALQEVPVLVRLGLRKKLSFLGIQVPLGDGVNEIQSSVLVDRTTLGEDGTTACEATADDDIQDFAASLQSRGELRDAENIHKLSFDDFLEDYA